jgi:hypothetical protein
MNIHRVIMEGYFSQDFTRDGEKKRRLNPPFTDVHLHSDGSVTREEDVIIAVQRIWRERIYAPPGTLFAPRGRMYKKIEKSFTYFDASDCPEPPHNEES